jgi:hypothetical protein
MAVGMLALSLGLHWGLLQTMAWTGMLVERVQSGSWWEAVETTFDGQHPCRMCLAVREAKSGTDESQELPQWKLAKLDVFPAEERKGWLREDPLGCALPRAVQQACATRDEPPESPPPRWV